MMEGKILARWPLERWSQLTVVVGCSGGADSTALLIALHRLRPASTTLVVAHYNHKLRGAESEADAAFVRNLAERLQLEFIEGYPEASPTSSEPMALATGDARTNDPSDGQSTPEASAYGSGSELSQAKVQTVDEASLRGMRYKFLERTAYQVGARYVAVGHHADDQVETVLHNLFRGSGLAGLSGMNAFRSLGQDLVLARPMIDVWRSEVADYLKSLQQSFRSDSSNASEFYTRNRIRNRLLPLIQEHYGRDVRSAVASAADLLGNVLEDIELQSQRWASEHLVDVSRSQFRIPCITGQSPGWHVIQQSIVNEYHRRGWSLGGYNREHWQSLRIFLRSRSGSSTSLSMLPDRVVVRRDSNHFVFERQDGTKA
jgi:tRNA(Ile)-lysidine synthase